MDMKLLLSQNATWHAYHKGIHDHVTGELVDFTNNPEIDQGSILENVSWDHQKMLFQSAVQGIIDLLSEELKERNDTIDSMAMVGNLGEEQVFRRVMSRDVKKQNPIDWLEGYGVSNIRLYLNRENELEIQGDRDGEPFEGQLYFLSKGQDYQFHWSIRKDYAKFYQEEGRVMNDLALGFLEDFTDSLYTGLSKNSIGQYW